VPLPEVPVRRVLLVAVVRLVPPPAAVCLLDADAAGCTRRVAGFAAAGLAAAGFAVAGLAAAGLTAAAGLAAAGPVATGFVLVLEAAAFVGVDERVVRGRTVRATAAPGFGAAPSLSALICDRRSATAAVASDACFLRFAWRFCAFCSRLSSFASFLWSAP